MPESGKEREIIGGLLEDAAAAFDRGGIAKAKALYSGILRLNPNDSTALRRLAAIEINAGEAQSAHHRIEALRNFLEHELGVRKFVQAYDIVKSTYHGADEPNSGERIGGILQSAELEYVSLIVQLIICEEGVYGQLSPAEAKGEMHRAICRLPQISTSISRPGQAGPLVT